MSVAIPIPLLQNLPDVNVTPAVGVDEYALVYDHGTGTFVLRAPVAAPDLSGYALLAGRAGGQTLYGGTGANDDITIHGTSDGTRTTSYVLLQPSGGNVGIGTTSPGDRLTVKPTSAGGITLRETDDENDAIRLVSGSTQGYADILHNNVVQVRLDANGPSWFNQGNVGIGTTTPATTLHVAGAATITGGIRPAADGTTALQLQTAAGANVLNVDTTNARVGIGTIAPGHLLHLTSTGSKGFAVEDTDSGIPYVKFISAGTQWNLECNRDGLGSFDIYQGGTGTRITLNTSGFLGINTIAPATRLDIDAGALTMAEMTAPTGIANKAMLYTKDTGGGKTALCVKLGDDVEIVLATQA